jgi:DNA-directed RNA polymerase sigma subunit (sigma70/sigma32)
MNKSIIRYQVNKHLLKLKDRYYAIFEYRNGVTDGKRHTLKETGMKFGICGGRVGQIEARVWYEVERL